MSGRRTVEERFSLFFSPPSEGAAIKKLGLAVSGGSDSMALMHLAKRHLSGDRLVVLCLDHAIEGENSAAEFAFVEEEARRLGLDFFGKRANPPVRAGRGLSLEMAAREARRAFFAEAARELRLDAIATGHQRDDVAETVLLRLLRGAGASGLSGLRPISPPSPPIPAIIRPLLDCGRAELRSWLRRHRVRWMDDVANSNEAIPRCRVRLSLIPALARAMGRHEDEIVSGLAQSAAILRDDDDCLDALAAPAQVGPLDLAALSGMHVAIARRAVRRWLMSRAGADAAGFDQVEALRIAGAGDSVNLPGGAIVDVDSRRVADIRAHAPAAAPPPDMVLPIPGVVRWGRYSITTSLATGATRVREVPASFPTSCALSLRAVNEAGGLCVRHRRAGETMAPFGLGGTRKLQDIFVDCKIPAPMRGAYPVVADAGGRVAWLPGYRIAAPFAVADGEASVRITVGEGLKV